MFNEEQQKAIETIKGQLILPRQWKNDNSAGKNP